jgi:phosphoheptose isomerase
MNNTVDNRINEVISILSEVKLNCKEDISICAQLIADSFLSGGKILICGNGGSAADSQHFAAEFVSAFARDLDRRALPALALTVDTSIITAFSNDFSFEKVFARQVEAYGQPGDVLIALTTSGTSANCLEAVKQAQQQGLKTIAFTQFEGLISKVADYSIEIPSKNTQHIQECHMVCYHLITELVEETLFRKGK